MDRLGVGSQKFFEANPGLAQIRLMLESNDSTCREQLDGMKYLLVAISQARDVSELYPYVAKLVISQNMELKKMICIFLVHYAEVQPEAALLVINTLKKDMNSTNQLTRANALKTISSIRVKTIAPLIALAIKQGAMDASPYVRKVSAHAIPKLYSLDPDQKLVLIEVIGKLMEDSAIMVLGSAIYSFGEVFPENWELIHQHYKKIVNFIQAFDEWSQIVVLNILLRYARIHFKDPNEKVKGKNKSHENQSKSETFNESHQLKEATAHQKFLIDPDLEFLLDRTLLLLKSQNAAVVLSTCRLHYYLSPYDKSYIIKTLIRIMKCRKEISYVVLSSIKVMALEKPEIFIPYLSDFFVSISDPHYNRILKIDIITILANESNKEIILREFGTYITFCDIKFVQATIQATEKSALRMERIPKSFMYFLISLIGLDNELIVAEAVVVLKRLLHNSSVKSKIENDYPDYSSVVFYISKCLEKVKISQARASIISIISENLNTLHKIAPDALRKLAKCYLNEEVTVKLQIITLGLRIFIMNPSQTRLLFEYILNLAKYDVSYDIRDRSRIIRRLLFSQSTPELQKYGDKLFLAEKPLPTPTNIVAKDGNGKCYTPGSFSCCLGYKVNGYSPIPDWSRTGSDPKLRIPLDQNWENASYAGRRNYIIMNRSAGPNRSIQNLSQSPANNRNFQNIQQNFQSPTNKNFGGFATREEYETNFWNDTSTSDDGDDAADNDDNCNKKAKDNESSTEEEFGDSQSSSSPSSTTNPLDKSETSDNVTFLNDNDIYFLENQMEFNNNNNNNNNNELNDSNLLSDNNNNNNNNNNNELNDRNLLNNDDNNNNNNNELNDSNLLNNDDNNNNELNDRNLLNNDDNNNNNNNELNDSNLLNNDDNNNNELNDSNLLNNDKEDINNESDFNERNFNEIRRDTEIECNSEFNNNNNNNNIILDNLFINSIYDLSASENKLYNNNGQEDT